MDNEVFAPKGAPFGANTPISIIIFKSIQNLTSIFLTFLECCLKIENYVMISK